MDRDAFKKVCKAQWKNPDDHGYIFVNTRKPTEDIKKKLEPKQIQQPLFPSPHQIEYPIEYDGLIIRTLDDINHYFSNPDTDLRKSISPIVDNDGLLFNGYRITFSKVSPKFIIDTKDFIFTTTEGLIHLMNGEDPGIADYKDLVEYSKFLDEIRRGRETNRSKEVKLYIKAIEHAEYEVDEASNYGENYPPITEQIDELEKEIARENSGQGMTFLSDNNEKLLN
ncbi:hypothetical protein LOTGIDRAFT_156691 [Lottia gigantea]|uniref:Uncharacterized protein n=1 Tax=Lottia gigantea TaxID=225164 RepID=V4AYN2_LOTGI|nr:hypothetical protein LOTGIDRAFT_156691 [Lottia gigantea]ESP02743.1 hypothetical protein LOTGIDRAFT_156691 [Lottia gigantea]